MEIVVRTPHGDADVSIVSHSPTTTLGDVVSAVTGQAVPRLVLVDDRVVDATTLLDDVRLVVGAVVTTEPSIPPVISIADADIVQIAGHGAGRVMRLGPGRYRIGPGRRSSAEELDVGPVERTVFELVVDPTGAASEVTIVPVTAVPVGLVGPELALDGAALTATRRWHQGTLTVGPRAFQLDNPARSDPARSLSMPNRDGTVSFSRPPRRRSAPDRRPVVDAVRDATLAAPTLWERRPNHHDAFVLPIGVRADSDDIADIVNADLGSNRAVAVTGSERFRGALARTLVVEAATLHGPSDLDLVVVTEPDRLAQWDWAKWLPHLRLDGPPAIWSSPHDITRWAEGVAGRAHLTASHLTMVILDDPGLWNRRDSPLRSIVSNLPDDLRLIALCDDAAQAPAACTALISETADGLARLHSFTRADDDGAMRAALTEAAVAVRVARALAPLADVELPTPAAPATREVDLVDLAELIGAVDTDQVLARWADVPPPTVAIGRRGHESIEVPVADDVTVVVGSSMGDAFDVAATSLIAQCADRSPNSMWIAPMMLEHGSRSELLWQLPHATDPHDLNTAIEPQRLLARLRTVLAEPEGPDRIVLVAEAPSASGTPSDETWLAALAAGVRATSGLAMVVVTDRSDTAHVVGDTVIRVERRDETGRSDTRRVATLLTPGGVASQTFTPLQRTRSPIATLELRPYVVGRALTPLERRIEHDRAQSANSPEPSLATTVALLRDAASRRRGDDSSDARPARAVVPPPMPSRVDLVELFAASPGDGVPLGLVDDPNTAGVRIRWWEPGNGSLLVFGSRRSGIEQTLATILLGIIDRFSTLDVRLVVIEHSSARRRALNGIDHAMRLVAPDQAGELVEALDEIAAELDRRAVTGTTAKHDGPRMVVVIGDLVQLRRRYADQPLGARIDEVLATAARTGSGVDVIAYAGELDGAGPFATIASSRLVGASSDHDELSELGVEHPSELEGIVGRCRCFPDSHLVQLAMPDATMESLLARRSIGGNR